MVVVGKEDGSDVEEPKVVVKEPEGRKLAREREGAHEIQDRSWTIARSITPKGTYFV